MNLLKKVLNPVNLKFAINRVVENDGAAGIDGMKVSELKKYVQLHGEELKLSIVNGS